jgi:ZIP family zinc transporter
MGWVELAVRAGVPVATALVGGLIGAAGAGERRLVPGLLVYFAAGAFLAVAALHLLPESAAHGGWVAAGAATAAGVGLCMLLARWAGGFCPACALGTAHESVYRLGLPLLVVLSLHSLFDGMALAAGDAHGEHPLSLAVLVHKLPEGLAIAAVCRSAGRSLAASVGWTALVESFTFAGLAFGLLLGHRTPGEAAGLGVVAGSFVYLAVLTFSGIREMERPALSALAGTLGVAVIGGARLLA